jgi:non-lysosomal glucosylceramidase
MIRSRTTFDGVEDAGRYILHNFDRLRARSLEWHDTLIRKDLPEWLRDAIINSTYVISSNSWLDERGRFAMLEATSSARQLGAIASFFHETGSLPVLEMFPELEKRFLEMVADNAREDGYIMHDFGVDSLDHPTGGYTYPPDWKDTGSVFVLLAYRDYHRMNDMEFLTKMYPKMMKASHAGHGR